MNYRPRRFIERAQEVAAVIHLRHKKQCFREERTSPAGATDRSGIQNTHVYNLLPNTLAMRDHPFLLTAIKVCSDNTAIGWFCKRKALRTANIHCSATNVAQI